ncbi:MAG: DNA polymerase, partial [Candidatus Omnitrophota bacterium]
MKKEKAFLIDGSALCYRAFYAIRALSTTDGRPTNAIYGFVSMLQKLVSEEKPEYLAVSFDLKAETFRKKAYEAYKIHRKPMPDELVEQLPVIKEVLHGYRIPIFEKEGYEGDDVLGTLAKLLSEKGIAVYIVTGDKDIFQLVDDNIFVYQSHKDGLVYDTKKVRQRYGVGPDKIVEIMSLCGDDSDNIPGVPGIGEKTAVALIQKFGTLARVLANVDKIEGESRRKNLKTYADQAKLSRELATVDTNVPLEMSLEDLRLKEPDCEKLYALFRDLEFRSLLPQFLPRSDGNVSYTVVRAEAEFRKFLSALRQEKRFAFDFETTSEDALLAQPIGISFSWKERQAFYVPLGKDGIPKERFFQEVRGLFEDETVQKIGQNIKYETLILARQGISLRGIAFDTMVASYLLNPSKPNHNLVDITLEYLHFRKTSISELTGKGASQKSMADLPLETVSQYACEDSDVTYRLSRILEKDLRVRELDDLFHQVELPLIEVLASMERSGVAIHTEFLKDLSEEMEKKRLHLTKEIYQLSGCEFNINSPKQLSEILYKKLKLPILKRTKTGVSTDGWVLENLAAIHPLPKTIVQYREISKLKSTYVDALPKLINPETGR